MAGEPVEQSFPVVHTPIVQRDSDSDTSLSGLISSFRPSATALALGAVSALVALILIEVTNLAYEQVAEFRINQPLRPLLIALPVAAGLLVGLGRQWRPLIGGFDRLRAGRVTPLLDAAWRFVLMLASISGGLVAGREEPTFEFVGSINRRLGMLSQQRVVSSRGALASALAGVIAASFGTPFAGLVFAVEVVVVRPRAGDLLATLAAAVFGGLLSRTFGTAALLPAGQSPVMLTGWLALVVVALAALVVGLAISSLIGLLKEVTRRFGLPLWLAPAAGGLAVGLLTLVSPAFGRVLVPAPAQIEASGMDPLWLLVAAGLTVALVVSLGLNAVGGLIMPVLAIGLALGAGLGALLGPFLGGVSPVSLAVAGAAVLLAAVLRTPFAAALLTLEMGADPAFVLAVGGLAWLVAEASKRIDPHSVYRELDFDEVDVMTTVAERMLASTLVLNLADRAAPVLDTATPLLEALETARAMGTDLAVRDARGRLVGLVNTGDIEYALLTDEGSTVADAMRREFPQVWPYQTLAQVLETPGVETASSVPIVDPREPEHLLGMLSRLRVLDTLGIARITVGPNAALASTPVNPAAGLELEDGGLEPFRLFVAIGSSWSGRKLRDLRLPREAYVAAIRRGDETMPARPETAIRSGDVLLGFASVDVRRTLERRVVADAAPSEAPVRSPIVAPTESAPEPAESPASQPPPAGETTESPPLETSDSDDHEAKK